MKIFFSCIVNFKLFEELLENLGFEVAALVCVNTVGVSKTANPVFEEGIGRS